MHGRNFGGQKANLVGPAGIPLIPSQGQIDAREQAMQEEHQRQIRSMVDATAREIYVLLAAKEVDLDKPFEPNRFRHLASAAIGVAGFFAEAKGLLKITLPSDAPDPEAPAEPIADEIATGNFPIEPEVAP